MSNAVKILAIILLIIGGHPKHVYCQSIGTVTLKIRNIIRKLAQLKMFLDH